jgi:hypothetical protein
VMAQFGSRFAGNRAPVREPLCTLFFVIVIRDRR